MDKLKAVEYIIKNFGGLNKGVPIFKDPFRILIATIISQRTRDETTLKVSKKLFETFPTPQSLAEADQNFLSCLLKPAGFYREKARKIKKVASIVANEGLKPDIEFLLGLPGVGRKTANIVLAYGFGIPAIAVDTHVHRISNRLGLVKTKTPEETESALKRVLPPRMWIPLNHSMVAFGKTVCRPVKPLCKNCEIRKYCDYGKRTQDSLHNP